MPEISPLDFCRSFKFDDRDRFQDFVRAAREGRPASFIRLGDGEAKLIGYPDKISTDLVRRQMHIWFGTTDMSEAEILDLRSALLTATQNATHIGMPAPGRTGEPGEIDGFSRDAVNCQALWARIQETSILSPEKTLATANVHTWSQKTRALADLLQLPSRFLFITRSPNAVGRIAEVFALQNYEAFIVPGEVWSRKDGGRSSHYPERFTEISHHLRQLPPKTVALVGAGILGKVYCELIRSAGGAAFDCGALFDAWADDIPLQRKNLTKDAELMTAQHLAGFSL
jgi:hypothetical protein